MKKDLATVNILLIMTFSLLLPLQILFSQMIFI